MFSKKVAIPTKAAAQQRQIIDMVLDASKYLNSYGWKGKGHALGENGLTKPIAVTKKQDTHGLGQDRNESFAWWDNIFNKAAKGVKIEKDEKGIAVKQTETAPTRNGMGIISYHKPKELQRMQFYSNFVESSASVTRSPSPTSEKAEERPKKRKRDATEAVEEKMERKKKSKKKEGKRDKKYKRRKASEEDIDGDISVSAGNSKDKAKKSSKHAENSTVDTKDLPERRKKNKRDKSSASSDSKKGKTKLDNIT